MGSPGILRPAVLLAVPGVIAGVSTRTAGSDADRRGMNLSYNVGDDPSIVRRNRDAFFRGLGITQDRLAIPGQVHGSGVAVVSRPGTYPNTDALVTAVPGIYLCVTVADCIPLLVADPVRMVVAAVHAGWRGAAAGIAAGAVGVMSRECGSRPDALVAFIGPSAGVCCYAVGEEVASKFEKDVVVRRTEGVFLDLKFAVLHQLVRAGLRRDRIDVSDACTICASGRFHSYRRDGARSGRMMAVIGIDDGKRVR